MNVEPIAWATGGRSDSRGIETELWAMPGRLGIPLIAGSREALVVDDRKALTVFGDKVDPARHKFLAKPGLDRRFSANSNAGECRHEV